jgi:hypothetical protein
MDASVSIKAGETAELDETQSCQRSLATRSLSQRDGLGVRLVRPPH